MMAKRILIYLFLSLLIASCEKGGLNITPDGRMTLEDIFKDEKRTEAALNTVYAFIPTYFWTYGFFDFLASYSDECYAFGGSTNSWATGSLAPDFDVIALTSQERGWGANHYPSFWTGIKAANIFLDNLGKAKVSSESNRSRFQAEAKVLRAFFYLELIKQYGPMPIIDKELPNDFDYASLKRPSFQEDVDFILKECDEAIKNPDLPWRITIDANRQRITKAIAYAIQSRATLYNASPLWNESNDLSKWQLASATSKKALDSLQSNGYALWQNNWGDYFLQASDISNSPNDKETIFEVNWQPGDAVFTVINGIPSRPGNFKVGATPTQELVDSYDMKTTGEPAILGYQDEDHLMPIINPSSGYDSNNPYNNRDPRFYATVWYNGAQYDNILGNVHTMETFIGGSDQMILNPIDWTNTRTGYYLRKFIDPRVQTDQFIASRWKIFRLAEVYLNLAEAENEANGPTAEAYAAINAIRSRVGMHNIPFGLTKEQFRQRVRNERRVELAIEESRFWDVRRWKILNQTDKIATGMRITKDTDGNLYYERIVTQRRNSWQDRYLIFPIPTRDASILLNFQNPGW